MINKNQNTCEICLKEKKLTKHHLIPKTRHKNKTNKKLFNREEVKKVLMICRSCLSQIHVFLTEKELERNYNSIEKLMAHEGIAKYAKWARTHKVSRIKVRGKSKK